MKRDILGKFVKGSNGNTYDGFGIWYDKKGYPTIYINCKNIKLHIYIWEKVNGKKPTGMQVHHKDNNKKNWNIDNLELVTQSDHFKIHAGWVRKNKIWIKKPCKDCKQLLPLDKFYQRKGLTPLNRCINCCGIKNKLMLKEDKTFRERKRLYLKDYYKKNKIEILKKQREKWKKRS